MEGIEATTGSAPVTTTSEQGTAGTTVKTGEHESGGDEAVFFSDLGNAPKKTPAKKADDGKDPKSEKKAELPAEAVEALKKSDKKETKDESDKTKGAESKEKDSKEAAGKEAAKKELEAQIKKIKAKRGDQEIELTDDDLIPVKIGGEEKLMTLKELRADKAGQVQWDKKFSELDKEKSTFRTQFKETEEKISAFLNAKDPDEKFFRMAEISGKSPVEARTEFLNSMLPIVEKYYSMTEDERNRDALEFENKHLRYEAETREKREKQEQATVALRAKVEQIRATHKIEEAEFRDQYLHLKDLQQKGTLTEDITPEFIAETIVKEKIWSAIEDAVEQDKIALNPSERATKILKLTELAFSQGLSTEDIKDVVSEVWGQKKSQRIVEQKNQQRQEFFEGKKTHEPSYEANADVWNFDQL